MTIVEIYNLKVGDIIKSYDEEENEWVESKVTLISIKENVYFIDISGEWIGMRWDVCRDELLNDKLYKL